MEVAVRPVKLEDVDAFIALLEEMKRSYGTQEFDPLDERRQDIRKALFSNTPAAYALLAWAGSKLVGLGTYSYHWPALGLTRSLYLKELYVTESVRRQGVGRAIVHSLFELAAEQGCSRVEWTTDSWNTSAQEFYRQLGAFPDDSKLFYRVRHDDMRRFLAD